MIINTIIIIIIITIVIHIIIIHIMPAFKGVVESSFFSLGQGLSLSP